MFLIQEASKISGVSVRTLHYYDEIELLSPQKAENQYRYYTEDDLNKLQQILFYKYLGFPLKEIKNMMSLSEHERLKNLKSQLRMLIYEKEKISVLINTIEKTIKENEGGTKMSINEKFEGFNFKKDKEKYREEAIEKYGEKTIIESENRQSGKEDFINEIMNQVFFDFADNLKTGIDCNDNRNIELAKTLHGYMNKYFFDCTLEIFESIGKGYVQDPRFKENIDKFGDGTAQYVSEAIQAYCKLNNSI